MYDQLAAISVCIAPLFYQLYSSIGLIALNK
jgi:hypothetical protein